MATLDVRTVVLIYALTNLVAVAVMVTLWARNRRRFSGLGLWVADFVLQFLALVLVALRDTVPPLLSATGSNTMAVGGTALLQAGLQRFLGVGGRQAHNAALVLAFALLHGHWVRTRPDLGARTVLLSLALLALFAQCAWLLLRRVDASRRPVTRPAGLVFLLLCLVSLARLAADLARPLGQDFFHIPTGATVLLLAYQMLTLLLAFSLFLMVNHRLVLALEEDVAARERAEALMRLRVDLWELAAGHSTQELMQRALDEIERLTGSSIAFYHFVEEDGRALTLQAWSTRTRAEFCQAEGAGRHYPVEQAGVWADSVRQRRAIVHNDYASLPGKRGLPEGHARLVRELVVPTQRGGRLVSVLGVGNKAGAYDERDVELVSHVADVVWTIVAQKRAEEEVHRLNTRLGELAMTDELTGLANRRSFFSRGGEEVLRARRYGSPLAVLLLDVDHFKATNDSFGHEAGDRVLQELARTLRAGVREVDLVARLGGEEFGVLLPSTGVAEAAVLAERMRLALESAVCRAGERSVPVTASFGVAGYEPEMPDLDALLRGADAALYEAKRQGRNRVVCSG